MNDQQPWDGVDRRRLASPPPRREWHLDRKVQVPHIIATITVLVTVVGYMASFDREIALLKKEQAHARERADSQERALRQVIDALEGRLARIEQGVERLVERYNAVPVRERRQ